MFIFQAATWNIGIKIVQKGGVIMNFQDIKVTSSFLEDYYCLAEAATSAIRVPDFIQKSIQVHEEILQSYSCHDNLLHNSCLI